MSENSQKVNFTDGVLFPWFPNNSTRWKEGWGPTEYLLQSTASKNLPQTARRQGLNWWSSPEPRSAALARAHQHTWLSGLPRCPWASPRCHSQSTSAWPGGGRTSASSSFSWTAWRSRHPSCAASLAWAPPAWSGTTGRFRPWGRTSGVSRCSWGHLSPQGWVGRGLRKSVILDHKISRS